MNKKEDTSLETELTQLMFQAISQNEELKRYIKKASKEGKMTGKSLLTFCLRPLSLIEDSVSIKGLAEKEEAEKEICKTENRCNDAVTAYKEEREETIRKNAEEPFKEESWLKKLRLISPF